MNPSITVITSKYTLLIIAIATIFTGCTAKPTDAVINQDIVTSKATTIESADNDSNIDTIPADNSISQSNAIKDRTKVEHKYLHGDEGYYSLIDDGTITSVKTQLSGTCWVTAAATSIESSYKKSYSKEIEVDYLDILDLVLCNKDAEGYLAKEGTDVYDIGGTSLMITETLSNGFGDYILTESQDYLDCDVDRIKEGIMTEGAITAAVNDSKYWRYDGYKTLIASQNDDIDHDVTLIGWDDNFPKEYFKPEATQNGAWLAQNTRGEYWGENGRYWISYDTPFDELILLKISDEYEGVLSYDGGFEGILNTGQITTCANVFHNKCTLKAVGTYITAPNQTIIINIYDDSFENVLYTQTAKYKLPGYYVIKLDKELSIQDYAIAISYEGDAPMEGSDPDLQGISYIVASNEGESFVLIDDKWLDLTFDDTIAKLGIDYEPNNCCIKAIY